MSSAPRRAATGSTMARSRAAGSSPAFATVAFGLSIWFTYLEAFVIHAWCQWCVVSAILCTLIFLAALPELKRLRNTEEA